ncbi:MAG TPA: DUF481 domain-containing protein [Terriglobia bacterium]|nr:DUF481 domain-containing protein [Terriglobia bacterium]
MNRLFLLAIIVGLGAGRARGEVIQFKNGDQLTGQWEQVLNGGLKFKSELVGEVTIPIQKLKSFSAPKPAVVILKDNQALRGKLSLLPSGEWQLAAEHGVRVLPEDAVEAIFPQEVYDPKSLEQTVAPWRNWRGTGTFGFGAVRGQLQSTTWNLGLNAVHKSPDLPGLTERWRTNFFLSSLFSNTQSASNQRISANSLTSGLRQDLLFTASDFVFALAQLDHIETQNLNLRQTYGAGFGRDIKRGSHTQFSLLGGSTLVTEQFYDGARRQNMEGLVGEKIGLGLAGRVQLQHFLNFYPNLTSSGQFRFETITTVSTHLFSHFSFNTSIADRYLSQPPQPTIQSNEVTFTTGLGYSF